MTGHRATVPTALTSAQLRAQATSAFPRSIPTKQLLSEQDIAELAGASLQPAGVPQMALPPRAWLPANEQIAYLVGAAQIALRDLDDQRAVVVRVEIGEATAVLRLLRAPNPDTVRCVHHVALADEVVVRALFGEPHCEVTLEWPA